MSCTRPYDCSFHTHRLCMCTWSSQIHLHTHSDMLISHYSTGHSCSFSSQYAHNYHFSHTHLQLHSNFTNSKQNNTLTLSWPTNNTTRSNNLHDLTNHSTVHVLGFNTFTSRLHNLYVTGIFIIWFWSQKRSASCTWHWQRLYQFWALYFWVRVKHMVWYCIVGYNVPLDTL